MLDRERQVRHQEYPELLLEGVHETGRPQGGGRLELERVLEEGAACIPEQEPDLRREDVLVPVVGDRLRAGLAEVVDHERVRRRVGAALGLLAGAALQ